MLSTHRADFLGISVALITLKKRLHKYVIETYIIHEVSEWMVYAPNIKIYFLLELAFNSQSFFQISCVF